MHRFLRYVTCWALVLTASVAWVSPAQAETGGIYIVTNGIDRFWDLAEAGARHAAKELKVRVHVLKPLAGTADQNRMVEVLIKKNAAGLAISPIDSKHQNDLINKAAAKMPVITFDSDAPRSKRQVFLGFNNLAAGRAVGKLVKEALPDGGNVMIFIGSLDNRLSKERTQGVIDVLLGLPSGKTAFDDKTRNYAAKNIKAGKYTIMGVRVDRFDIRRARQLPKDALARPNAPDCMVGLFAYNPPAILKAVRHANKLGNVKIVGFDELPETLRGIVDGHIHGTVSLQPFNLGYHAVQTLKALIDGDKSIIPKNKAIDMELLTVRKENAQKVWDKLKADLASVQQ